MWIIVLFLLSNSCGYFFLLLYCIACDLWDMGDGMVPTDNLSCYLFGGGGPQHFGCKWSTWGRFCSQAMVNPSYTPLLFPTSFSHMALTLAAASQVLSGLSSVQMHSISLLFWVTRLLHLGSHPASAESTLHGFPSVRSHKCNPKFSFDQCRQKQEMIGLPFLCFWASKRTTVLAGFNCQHLTLALLPDCPTCCQSLLEHLGIALGLAAWEPGARITDNDYGT